MRNMYTIKAAHTGPQWVQIGPACNPIDLKNHMHLSKEQEQAYQQALALAKSGDVDGATDVLRPLFQNVWIEREGE